MTYDTLQNNGMRFFIAACIATLLLGANLPGFSQGGSASTAAILDIGASRQLFIDDQFTETMENLSLRVNQPHKTGEAVLISDKPWENATLNWFSVLEDKGAYRMWYECYDVAGWPTADDTSFCYAESTDGIRWVKPALGLYSYLGSPENNILFRQIGEGNSFSRVHGTGIFLDPQAPPEQRYKAVSQGNFQGCTPPQRIAGMYSPDGIHWTRIPGPICDVFADSQYSAWWDQSLKKYVLLGRVSGRGRAIGVATSADFSSFPPLELALDTDDRFPPNCDLYNPAALQYPYADHVYFMFPSLYNHVSDCLDIHLAASRDGRSWTWPEPGKPFVALGDPGAFDSGSLYMGQGMIRKGNDLWMYYSGSPLKHNETELDTLADAHNRRVFSRLSMPIDRLVALQAGDTEGRFVTPVMRFSGSALTLNYASHVGGMLRIGLLDASANAVPSFSLDECQPLDGDSTGEEVAWKNGANVSCLSGTPIRMEVRMKNADLYAFQFVARD